MAQWADPNLGRGRGDYLGSLDIEDIVTLLDGRVEVVEDVSQADEALRLYLAKRFSTLLTVRPFLEALAGHLPPDAASQARLPIILEHIRAIGRAPMTTAAIVKAQNKLAAHEYIVRHNPNLIKTEKRRLRESTFRGVELVQGVARLCAMNLLLHGIGSQEGEPIEVTDSLRADPGDRYEVVLTNPPFGKKSSFAVVGQNGEASKEKETCGRDDFWATTSNKQLSFVQHVKTLLTVNGRAAVVIPDNVLFFDKKAASETPWTNEFVACYRPRNRHERKATWSEKTPDGRWRAYPYDELVARDKASLDIFWLKDESLEDSDNLPDPAVIAAEIVEDLRAALEQFEAMAEDMNGQQPSGAESISSG